MLCGAAAIWESLAALGYRSPNQTPFYLTYHIPLHPPVTAQQPCRQSLPYLSLLFICYHESLPMPPVLKTPAPLGFLPCADLATFMHFCLILWSEYQRPTWYSESIDINFNLLTPLSIRGKWCKFPRNLYFGVFWVVSAPMIPSTQLLSLMLSVPGPWPVFHCSLSSDVD